MKMERSSTLPPVGSKLILRPYHEWHDNLGIPYKAVIDGDIWEGMECTVTNAYHSGDSDSIFVDVEESIFTFLLDHFYPPVPSQVLPEELFNL